jgi:hypothetical protein
LLSEKHLDDIEIPANLRINDQIQRIRKVEPAAMLPGTALLLEEEAIAFRCSYVDYDGTRALEDWRRQPPSSAGEKKEFVRRNCPLLTDGVSHLGRYLEQVRAGRKPEDV